MKPNLHQLTEKDILALIELASEIGWGYNRDNWLQFLRLGTVLGHRDSDGRPISSAVMIHYADKVHWLTSFIVSPRFQRQGLATELWLGLKSSVVPAPLPVGLVSTEEGIPFYESIGFKQVASVYKYVRTSGLDLEYSGTGTYTIRAASKADLHLIVALDTAARGVLRKEMLEGKLQMAKSAIVACDSKGQPTGFVTAVMEGELLCIGPVVAADENSAADLIIEAAKSHDGPVRIDLVAGKENLMRTLVMHGFKLERSPPVLSYRGLDLPSTSNQYMALAAQAFG